MAQSNVAKLSFNAGIFGAKLLAREDFSKYPNAAEELLNFRPMVQGGTDRS